jgi:hypothetical protein
VKSSVNSFLRQQISNTIIEEPCLLCGPGVEVITRAEGAMTSVMGFSPGSNDKNLHY